MRDTTWHHLRILVTAARAHVRGDIGPCLVETAHEQSRQSEHWVRLEDHGEFFLSIANREVFQRAALEMIELHLVQQSGYRRALLRLFRWVFPRTRWLWWPVMQSWRRHSWNWAVKELDRKS